MMKNPFQSISVLDYHTIHVEPKWMFELKDGSVVTGNRMQIRDLNELPDIPLVFNRLKKLFEIVKFSKMEFLGPELVNADDRENALISCTVYLARTNISYYFPEYIPHKQYS